MLKKNQVCKHVDTGRLMKVILPQGICTLAREPKGRTQLVSTSKLRRSNASLAKFRIADR